MVGRRAHEPREVYAIARRCVGPASAVQPDGEPDPRFVRGGAPDRFPWRRRHRAARDRAGLVRCRASHHCRRNGGHGGPRAQPAAAGATSCHSAKDELADSAARAGRCFRLPGDQDARHLPSFEPPRASSGDLRASCAAPAPATIPCRCRSPKPGKGGRSHDPGGAISYACRLAPRPLPSGSVTSASRACAVT